MVSISGVEGAGNGLAAGCEAGVAADSSRRGEKSMSKWSAIEAFLVLALGFMGGWGLVVFQYSANHGLPTLAVASSSISCAILGAVLAGFAGVGCFWAASGSVWTITRSGASELAAALSSFTASAVGLHAALWLVG